MNDADAISKRFALPGVLKFESTSSGLTRAIISTPEASAEIYLQGAHVTHYQRAGEQPLLFLSAYCRLEKGVPIRGGIPVIFPWFGPKAGEPEAPAHGIARTALWQVAETRQELSGAVTMTLTLDSEAVDSPFWTAPFTARMEITVGAVLDLRLHYRNLAAGTISYEDALHTYFAVSDVRQVAVEGLAETEYLDKTDGMRRKREGREAVRITAETDRTYLNTSSTCTIDDPGAGRRILIEKWGSRSTVLWNPWIARAREFRDLGDDEWPQMLCVESVNAADNAIQLAPGAEQVTRVVLHSTPLQGAR